MDASVNNISIIVAMTEKGVIGREENIPWHLGTDLKRFRDLTMGHTVIVGRKTQESILRRLKNPLPGRHTIVLTRNQDYRADGCDIAHSWEKAMNLVKEGEVFVIGGAEIYKVALPHTQKIYMTMVLATFEGDAFFPEWNTEEWVWKGKETPPRGEKDECNFVWMLLKRVPVTQKAVPSYVVMENARFDDQRLVMEKIKDAGVCPFCPEHLEFSELEPVIWEGVYWHVRKNRWPYENTRVHLLFIHRTHAERLEHLKSEAWTELLQFVKKAEIEYGIEGGAFWLRFGDQTKNGGTVQHLHIQLLAALVSNKNDQDYRPVRVRVG